MGSHVGFSLYVHLFSGIYAESRLIIRSTVPKPPNVLLTIVAECWQIVPVDGRD